MSSGEPEAAKRPRRRTMVAIALAAVAAAGVAPPAIVHTSTADDIHDDLTDLRPAPVAIVLGAGIDGAGRPTPLLHQRIDVAVQLYRSGQVRALLMSGDNSRTDYDEVGAMAAQAQRLGVPTSAIVTDHAGFDTFSSCYRAKSVWGISRAIVISQPFHLPRAVWLCERLGIEAQGAGTPNTHPDAAAAGWVREIPATHKAVLDVGRGRIPTFPGPREHHLDGVTGTA